MILFLGITGSEYLLCYFILLILTNIYKYFTIVTNFLELFHHFLHYNLSLKFMRIGNDLRIVDV